MAKLKLGQDASKAVMVFHTHTPITYKLFTQQSMHEMTADHVKCMTPKKKWLEQDRH